VKPSEITIVPDTQRSFVLFRSTEFGGPAQWASNIYDGALYSERK